ncbi:MAG: hypothetical protein ABSF50_19350 [Burkholderiaceae bacterium]|jgi:hypothetical protein
MRIANALASHCEKEDIMTTSLDANRFIHAAALVAALFSIGILGACSGGDSSSASAAPAPAAAKQTRLATADEAAVPASVIRTVPRATCGPEDHPETGLQGQVPAALRAAGFKGFNCNLKLIGQYRGEGASWQHAFYTDRDRHRCSYYDTSSPVNGTANRTHLGTVAVDTTDRRTPAPTSYLTTTSMLDPWESLKVHERRALLLGENGTNAAGGPELDVYDISGDCRNPQLLASVATGTAANGDAAALPAGEVLKGHEGNVSPDGLTWYSGDRGTPKKYTATDITDARHPVLITTWTLPEIYPATWAVTTHGLAVSEDGRRAYVSHAAVPSLASVSPTLSPVDGVLILDTSQVQERRPNPQITEVSHLFWQDGAQSQMYIPVTIKGHRYLVGTDEVGAGGGNASANVQAACNAGLPTFPMARIIDIDDEKHPRVASRLLLETHDPANCSAVLPDIVGLSVFTYGSHYCSVDNKHDATTLACAYFNSGIRVFDIRDPEHPREIAYFNPPGVVTPSYGSQHYNPNAFIKSGTAAGDPDWCTAQLRLDAEHGTLETTCQDNGLLVLKFENGVWPFRDSSTPPGAQN